MMIDKFLERTLAYNERMVDAVNRHRFPLVDVTQSNVTELTERCLSKLGIAVTNCRVPPVTLRTPVIPSNAGIQNPQSTPFQSPRARDQCKITAPPLRNANGTRTSAAPSQGMPETQSKTQRRPLEWDLQTSLLVCHPHSSCQRFRLA